MTTPNDSWWDKLWNWIDSDVILDPGNLWSVDFVSPLGGVAMTGGRVLTFLPNVVIDDVEFPIPVVNPEIRVDDPMGPPPSSLQFSRPLVATTGGAMNSRKD